ncbi:probable cytosolic iron-sulfur protein assembly protein CIAO1 homolog isoform X1 [Biomphalaria glabrata]|uniref:Probable cytosolic iron-sulfur protein assembly protein CIAO1 homolog n=2 Tax=Biomphalaria glabrata TaxID=6526 RepID=A0A9U8EFD4_BIOGL|nr:probable cytosolic iron-sulfur protein assembly protein CIAO1 homolog isoform X1 [Biomphalaria glabrata]
MFPFQGIVHTQTVKRLKEMHTLTEVETLSGHSDRVWCVSWSPNGSLLASCGGDKSIRIWGKEGEKWICKSILTDGHTRTVRSVSWSPCGMYLAAASFDATTSVWSRKAGEFECLATLEGHENEVKSTSWACTGNLLATCSRDKSVWIWEVTADEEFECASVMSTHTQDVKRVKWHPNKEILASCSYDDTVRLYREQADDWECFTTLKGHSSTVWAIDFDKTGSRLASCSADATVKIWQEYEPGNPECVATPDNVSTWKCVCTIGGYHERAIYDISWSHLSGLLATSSGDDSLCIFSEIHSSDSRNQPQFELVARVRGAHSQDVNCTVWSPTEEGLLASCSDDGTIKLWKLERDEK